MDSTFNFKSCKELILEITSYPPNSSAQIQAFLSTIHQGAGGKYINYSVQTFDGPLSRSQHIGSIEAHSFDRITTLLEQFPKADVKNYIHSFNWRKKIKSKPICPENLNMIDTIALSFETEEMGHEKEFINRLFAYCVKNDIPIPNAYSLTGDGGVDIFYCIGKANAPTLLHGIQTLAWNFVIWFESFLDELEADNIRYTIERDMIEYYAAVRLPGTMHPKTGLMCQFFKTNVETYTYNELYNIIHPDIIGNGSSVKKKVDYSQLIKHVDKVTPRDDSWGIMLDTKIDGLLNLASVYDLSSHSDEAIYLMAQFCKGKFFSEKKTYKLITELTKLIKKPISKEKIMKAMDSDFRWFKTSTIAKKLGLSIDDERFANAFHVKGKYKKPKEKKLNSKQSAKASLYIVVANELKNGNTKAKDIVAKTGYTINQVKKCCREIRKNADLINKWTNTTLDDVDFILEYFERNKAIPAEETSKGKEEKNCAKKFRKKTPILIKSYLRNGTATADKAVNFDERSLRKQKILAEKGQLPDRRKISIGEKPFDYEPYVMETKPLLVAKPRTPFKLPPETIEKMLTGSETIDQSKPLTMVPEIYEVLYYYTADQRKNYDAAEKNYKRALKYHNTDEAQKYADICNNCAKHMRYAVTEYNSQMRFIKIKQPQFRNFDPVELCKKYNKAKPAKPKLSKDQRSARRDWRRQAAQRSERTTCQRILDNIVHAPNIVVDYARKVISNV